MLLFKYSKRKNDLQGRITSPLVITAIVTAFGSSFPHGYNTGVLNAPSKLIQSFINETYTIRIGTSPSDSVLSLLWSATVAIYLVGGCAGAFSAGWLADKFGRKKALLVCHIFGFVAAILFGLCDLVKSAEMLIIGRIVVGFGCGAGSGLVPMYLTEIAPVNIRGAMGVLHQFALTCGIFVSQILGMQFILGTEALWPVLLAFTAFPCVVSLIILPFYPDSPRYLLVNKGNEPAAVKALQRFRGTTDVHSDILEMKNEYKQQLAEPKWSFKKLFTAKSLRLPLLIVCALACAQQLSGINVVFYYSVDVFEASGIPPDKTQYAVLATGFINVAMTAISVPLMEKCGRRILLWVGMSMMVIAAAIITVALNLQETVHWMSYFSMVCTFLFVVGFSLGLGSIPQFIGAELFKQGPRPPAMSFAGLLNWLCNFLVGILFPSMQMVLQAYSFLVFIGFLIAFGVFLYWKMPETKNKTYEEIYRVFAKKNNDDESNAGSPMTELTPVGNNQTDTFDEKITENEHASLMRENDYNKKQHNKNGKDIYIPNGGNSDGVKLLDKSAKNPVA